MSGFRSRGVGGVLVAVAAATVATAAALASGCGSEVGARGERAGTLVVVDCPDTIKEGRCARLGVRENRSDPRGRTIQLHIATLPATGAGPHAEPVFALAGGPGQAATELTSDPTFAHPAMRRRRDLVFVDQRGTGGSNGLLCRFYGGREAQSYFDPFMPIEKVRACRDELSKRADLSQYTTAASVEDLEEVRRALGYDRINLIGGSYGTRLALEYVRRHGDRVRAVVLDGAVPPSVRIPENFGRLAQRSLDLLLDECAATADCANRFGDIRAKARSVFDRLRQGPVSTTVVLPPGSSRLATVTLTRDNVGEAIRYMTYIAGEASHVPLVLHEAAQGNYSPIAEFLLRWRGRGMFEALYLSITCAEDVPLVPADAAERDDPTYLGGYRVREQRAACAEWPRGAVPAWHGQPVRSDVPTLILSGALDPVTPPEHGDEIAASLPNSLHVRVPFAGHSSYGLDGQDCLHGIVRSVIEKGSVSNVDGACAARDVKRPGFDLGQPR